MKIFISIKQGCRSSSKKHQLYKTWSCILRIEFVNTSRTLFTCILQDHQPHKSQKSGSEVEPQTITITRSRGHVIISLKGTSHNCSHPNHDCLSVYLTPTHLVLALSHYSGWGWRSVTGTRTSVA